MESTLTAIELTGTVDEHQQLQLDDILPIPGPKRVRVIVLYSPIDDWGEKEWLHAATRNPALDFLKEPEEDIYLLSDGKPYHDEVVSCSCSLPFPLDDLSSVKARPAVCLTDLIGSHDHLILAFITSHIPTDPLKTDLIIGSSDPNFASTGLRVSSTLQLHRLMTVTKSLLQRELGVLSPAMQAQVQERLRALFGLNSSHQTDK